jgi:hypothetical protein
VLTPAGAGEVCAAFSDLFAGFGYGLHWSAEEAERPVDRPIHRAGLRRATQSGLGG